jgi:acyl-CoA synthetase (AMP-forming)/AMP-acid ligase II
LTVALGAQVGDLIEPLTGRRWDLETIQERCGRRVALYRAKGLRAGDRVFVHFGNTCEFFVELLAIWQLGGCVAPIDPRLTPFEVEILARWARPRFSVWEGVPDDEMDLAWRFRNPLREYRFLYAGDDRLDGYLVLQCQRGAHGRARVNVVDWEATDASIRDTLLDAALTDAFAELATWTASLDADTRDLLRRRAFTPIDEADAARGVPGVLIRPVRDDALRTDWTIGGRRLLDLANWDLRMLYSMHG